MPCIALLVAALLGQAEPGRVQAGGYLGGRGGWALGWSGGGPPVAEIYGTPAGSLLVDANLQLRVRIAEGYDVFTDSSLYVNAVTEASGAVTTPSSVTNRVEASELYLNLGFHEHAHGLLGRKRIVWGSGFAWNPADLLNPPKDPTDPTLQRTGAWMARVEAPFEQFTLTALWAPKIVRTQAGLPSRFLYDVGGDEARQLVAARAYALLLESDVNLMWFWSNRYADNLPHSHRFAASFSRYFFTDYELHFEGVLQRGRDTAIVDAACVPDGAALAGLSACREAGRPVVSTPFARSDALYANLIVGTRYTFSDESLLSVEYLYNGTGLSGPQYAARGRLLEALPTVLALSADPQAAAALNPFTAQDPGQPLRFSLQTLRRHYLFLVFQKPRLFDDFTVTATAVVGLEDPSAMLAPSVAWSAREWLSLAFYGYVPVGTQRSEFGGLPFRFRGLLEAKAFY